MTAPRRAFRAAAGLAALSVVALTSAGAGLPPAATTTTAAPATATTSSAPAAEPCLSAASGHRVRAGSAVDGVDPNSLGLAGTERAQRAEDRATARAQQRRTTSSRLGKTTIDVYVHVITSSTGQGDVSDKRVKKQIDVLNRAYAGKTSKYSTKSPFSFRLRGIDRTRSSAWYRWDAPTDLQDGDDVAPKVALHRGGPGDLNLYTAALNDGLLGYATFPWETKDGLDPRRDGVVVLGTSLPDGSARGYDRGDSATHEVGHWLGLLHTFENGCRTPGDLVDDTPAQADGDNVFSCSKLDTCKAKGRDPVHNFMSYGDDACLTRFSKGQVVRMSEQWQLFRSPAALS